MACFRPRRGLGLSEKGELLQLTFIILLLLLRLLISPFSSYQVALPIMSKFTARTNGSFIKIAHSSVGWSYYSSDPEFGSLQAKHLVLELERELASFDVRFVNLKGIVEVIPRRLNKGIIVKKILRDIAARDNNAGVDFILCMGDDVSDEKMFSVSTITMQ